MVVGPGAAVGVALEDRVGAGHRVSRHGQDPGEHGDRPQRHARPVGLDERSRYPFLGVGLGHRVQRGVMEALAQLHPPHVHQHSRQGQGSRLRDHADRPEPKVGAAVPVPADLQPAADAPVRVGGGRPRPGHRRHTQAREAVVGGAQGPQRHRRQGARADHQGLPRLAVDQRRRLRAGPARRTRQDEPAGGVTRGQEASQGVESGPRRRDGGLPRQGVTRRGEHLSAHLGRRRRGQS